MSRSRNQRWKRLGVAAAGWFVFASTMGTAAGQTVRGPDLGVWFRHERAPDGSHALVVADLINEGALAQAGLCEGDRIVSMNSRQIDREAKFVDAFLTAGSRELPLVIERGGRQATLTIRASE